MWRRAWVDGVDQYEARWWEAYRLVQNSGRGLLIQGSGDWTDYTVSSTITLHMAEAAGLAARVGGMRRYYALLLRRDGKAQLVKALDGDKILAETDFAWEFGETHDFALTVKGTQIAASLDGKTLFTVDDTDRPLAGGGIALVVEEGRIMSDAVAIAPAARRGTRSSFSSHAHVRQGPRFSSHAHVRFSRRRGACLRPAARALRP